MCDSEEVVEEETRPLPVVVAATTARGRLGAIRAAHGWNVDTSVEDLGRRYRSHFPVSQESLDLVDNMLVIESTVSTAIARITDSLDFSGADYEVAEELPQIQSLYDDAFDEYAPDQFKAALRHLLLYGFVAFKTSQKDVAGSDAVNKAPVSIVQDPSLYTSYVCVREDGSPTVVCLPKEGKRVFENPLGGGATSTTTGSEKVDPLQTYVWECPEAKTGRLRSPCASLVSEWVDYSRTSLCRIRAMVGSANPIPLFKHTEPKGTSDPLATSYTRELTAMAHWTGTQGSRGEHVMESPAAEMEAAETREREEALRKAAQKAVVGGTAGSMSKLEYMINNPTLFFGKGVVLQSPVHDASIIIPRGMEYAGSVAAPHPPPDAGEELQNFRTAVASCFGVPLGVMGLSASARAAATVSDHEVQWFITKMAAYKSVIERCATRMVTLATNQTNHVQVPVRVPLSLETLWGMFESYMIDRRTMNEEGRRAYGMGGTDFSTFSAKNLNGPSVARPVYGARGKRVPTSETSALAATKRPRSTKPPKEGEPRPSESDDELLDEITNPGRSRVVGRLERRRGGRGAGASRP